LNAERRDAHPVVFRVDPPVSPQELDGLFAAAWPGHAPRDWCPVLKHSLVYLCAYSELRLVGFVNVAWDGGIHGFILDTTVHPEFRRRGIGRRLVLRAASEARDRRLEWLHVDFEPHLRSFYDGCGFGTSEAGLMHLGASERTQRAGNGSARIQHS
jgi:ribosomal protein S18 acetylase RimI-like enzyme